MNVFGKNLFNISVLAAYLSQFINYHICVDLRGFNKNLHLTCTDVSLPRLLYTFLKTNTFITRKYNPQVILRDSFEFFNRHGSIFI